MGLEFSGPFQTRIERAQRPWLPRLGGLAILVVGASCSSSSPENANLGNTPSQDGGGVGTPPSFGERADAGPATDEKCQTLNIGILGIPGENASSNFQTWLSNAGTSTRRLQTNANDVLTSEVLAPFDVVVLDHLRHDHTPAEAAAFRTWLESGKGAVSMTGYLNAAQVDFRANALIEQLGVQYTGDILDGPVTTFFPHPITKGLSSITFAGGYVIQEQTSVNSKRTLLATIPEGNIGYAIEIGQGRAFVWGDEWIEFDSEWTTLPQIKQLWVQAFEWLAPNRCKLNVPR